MPRPYGAIDGSLCSPKHEENIGPRKPFCAAQSHREPSTALTSIQPYDEEEKGTGDRRLIGCARHEARQYHRLHQWNAVGSPPRPSTNTPRIAQSKPAGAGKQQIVASHQEDLRRRRHAVGCHWRARPPSTSHPQRDHSLPTTAACAGACC